MDSDMDWLMAEPEAAPKKKHEWRKVAKEERLHKGDELEAVKSRFARHKGSNLSKLATKVYEGDYSGAEESEDEAAESLQEGIEAGNDLYGAGTDIAELAKADESAMEAAGVGGATLSCLKAIKDIIAMLMSISDAKEDPDQKDKQVKKKDDIITAVLSGLDAVTSVMDFFTALANAVPIIGAILGTVSAIKELVVNIGAVTRARESRIEVGELKKQNKMALINRHGDKIQTKKDTSRFYQKAKMEDKFDKMKAAQLREELIAKRTEDKGKKRGERMSRQERKRLDEDISSLDEYFMDREIKHADFKRERQGGFDIAGEILNLAGSLASFDPAIGSAVGAGLKAGSTLIKYGHKGFTAVKQWGRDKKDAKKTGADAFLSKSTENKDKRRTAMGMHMVQKLYHLGRMEIEDVDVASDKYRERDLMQRAGNEFDDAEKQIKGMGVYYSVLLRAPSKKSLAAKFGAGMSREGDSESQRGLVATFSREL